MKRAAAAIACLLLALSVSAAAAAPAEGESVGFPAFGVSYAAPESFRETLGTVSDPMEFEPLPGLLVGVIAYLPRTTEEAALYMALLQRDEPPSDEEEAFLETYYDGAAELLALIGVSGMTAEDALAMLYPAGSPFREIVPVGKQNGYEFTAVTFDYDDPYFSRVLGAFPEGMEEDLKSVAAGLTVRAEDFDLWWAEPGSGPLS